MNIDPTSDAAAVQLAQTLLVSHQEQATYSHMAWLVRETAKLMARDFELTRREHELKQREATLGKKPRRGRRSGRGSKSGGDGTEAESHD